MNELPPEFQWLSAGGGEISSKVRCDKCLQKIDCSGIQPFSRIICPACGKELIVPVNFGGYQLYGILNSSRNTVVYEARDSILERNIALKVPIHPETNDYYRECFSALAQNPHPGILWIYNFSSVGELCCGALQLMDFGSCRNSTELRRRFGSSRVVDKLLPVARVLELFEKTGRTHRDIWPGNLLCSSSGEIRLTNLHPGGEADWLEAPRHWKYQAPEALCNMEFSSSADIYSFALSMYEILCSNYPFRNAGTPDDLMDLVYIQRPELLSGLNPLVPLDFAKTINACIEPQPAARPSAGELVKSMRVALAEMIEREFA